MPRVKQPPPQKKYFFSIFILLKNVERKVIKGFMHKLAYLVTREIVSPREIVSALSISF